MFIGSYSNSLDAKYRMIIPSKYREELGTRCIVTIGIDRCLYIYPLSEYEAQAAKLETLPKMKADVRDFVRDFYGRAEECEVDRQGRITISAKLRDYAKIEKDLETIGTGKKIEVWARDIYEDSGAGARDGVKLAEGLAEYGI